jgi:2',3'-cyclic-nucleotide 2'-phosphodiesterase (5'-nucleotidase family)
MGGLARRASAIDAYRGPELGLLVLDGGDALLTNPSQATEPAAHEIAKAATILRASALIGMDALGVGEGEIAIGVERVKALAAQVGLRLLGANVVDARGRPVFAPRALVSTGGIRVGILALLDLPPLDKSATAVLARARVRTTDPVVEAGKQVRLLLQEGAELVVLIAHMPVDRARAVARAVRGIHLVVLGHSGLRLAQPEAVGGAFLLEAGRRGRELGHAVVRLGDGWAAPTALHDDSPRFVMWNEAVREVEDLRREASSLTSDTDEARLRTGVERVRSLAKRIAGLGRPATPHTLVSTVDELDDRYTAQSAVQALLSSSREAMANPAPPPAPSGIRGKVTPRPIQPDRP